mmetsp:Transcript_27206/g.85628  ORF Transcript_27206/g.85628 Transcript_27206/m.85628 type:complete len:258 (-) Transcript_27206:336-1109(-)
MATATQPNPLFGGGGAEAGQRMLDPSRGGAPAMGQSTPGANAFESIAQSASTLDAQPPVKTLWNSIAAVNPAGVNNMAANPNPTAPAAPPIPPQTPAPAPQQMPPGAVMNIPAAVAATHQQLANPAASSNPATVTTMAMPPVSSAAAPSGFTEETYVGAPSVEPQPHAKGNNWGESLVALPTNKSPMIENFPHIESPVMESCSLPPNSIPFANLNDDAVRARMLNASTTFFPLDAGCLSPDLADLTEKEIQDLLLTP